MHIGKMKKRYFSGDRGTSGLTIFQWFLLLEIWDGGALEKEFWKAVARLELLGEA